MRISISARIIINGVGAAWHEEELEMQHLSSRAGPKITVVLETSDLRCGSNE